MLEILVGVVEDDEGLVLYGGDRLADFAVQRIDIGVQGRQVGLVGHGVGGVFGGKRLLDRRRHRLCVGGIEPQMRVETAFLMCIMAVPVPAACTVGASLRRVFVFVRLECSALARLQLLQAGCALEFDDLRLVAEGFERLFQECFEPMADPEDDIRVLQRCRIGWLQRVGMGRGGALARSAAVRRRPA